MLLKRDLGVHSGRCLLEILAFTETHQHDERERNRQDTLLLLGVHHHTFEGPRDQFSYQTRESDGRVHKISNSHY